MRWILYPENEMDPISRKWDGSYIRKIKWVIYLENEMGPISRKWDGFYILKMRWILYPENEMDPISWKWDGSYILKMRWILYPENEMDPEGCPTKHDYGKTIWKSFLVYKFILDIQSATFVHIDSWKHNHKIHQVLGFQKCCLPFFVASI